MEVLDEEGRLFGRVNIVDALVVLFAVAVIVAGAALVFGDSPAPTPEPGGDTEPEPEERTLYVTLLATGDTATALDAEEVQLDGTSANITDVHRTPGPRSYLRVALNGTESEGRFQFGDSHVRVGDTYTVTNNVTRTGSRVVERDVAPEFDDQTTTVTVETTVRTPLAEAVSEGDEQQVGNETVLEITDTETTQVNDTHADLQATLDLETRAVDDTPYYGGRPVRLGRELTVGTDEYEFAGEIIART